MTNELIYQKAQKIKLLILDVDGVLTDGKIWLTPQGDEYKIFHVHDGLGIKRLQWAGIAVAVISSRNSPAVKIRLQELEVKHYYLGQPDKMIAFQQLLKELQLSAENVVYVGDDLPDLPVMTAVGLSIAVANAVTEVAAIADWQTQKKGGQGAVREVCDLILKMQNSSS